MLLTVVVLLVAVGLLVAALGTGQVALAWGSVALSAVVAAMIVARWRRRRDTPEVEPVVLLDDEPARDAAPVAVSAASGGPNQGAEGAELADAEAAEPGEEDTDAADLLVVYELTDHVLVVDEHPRYHLTRCPWPDQARAERLSVREARELGFTPCDRCRPDTALARRHRATSAITGGS